VRQSPLKDAGPGSPCLGPNSQRARSVSSRRSPSSSRWVAERPRTFEVQFTSGGFGWESGCLGSSVCRAEPSGDQAHCPDQWPTWCSPRRATGTRCFPSRRPRGGRHRASQPRARSPARPVRPAGQERDGGAVILAAVAAPCRVSMQARGQRVGGAGMLYGVTMWIGDGTDSTGPSMAPWACMMMRHASRMSCLRSWCKTAVRRSS
jgi:hypothetical protein